MMTNLDERSTLVYAALLVDMSSRIRDDLAVEAVLRHGQSMRAAAQLSRMSRTRLRRLIDQHQERITP